MFWTIDPTCESLVHAPILGVVRSLPLLTALGMQSPIGLIALAGLACHRCIVSAIGDLPPEQRIKAAEQRAVKPRRSPPAVRSASVAAAMTMLIAAGRSPRLPIRQFHVSVRRVRLGVARPSLDGTSSGWGVRRVLAQRVLPRVARLARPARGTNPRAYGSASVSCRSGRACAVGRRGSSAPHLQVPIAQNADQRSRLPPSSTWAPPSACPTPRVPSPNGRARQASVREITVPLTSCVPYSSRSARLSAVNVDLAVIDVRALRPRCSTGSNSAHPPSRPAGRRTRRTHRT